MKKLNWKTRALEMRALAIAQAEGLKESRDPRSAAYALMLIGKAKLAEELLAEYGVDATKERKTKKTNLNLSKINGPAISIAAG